MNRLINYVLTVVVFFLFIQCDNDKSFFVAKNNVGEITNETMVSDISILYENDSIVNSNNMNTPFEFKSDTFNSDEYLIYAKEGSHLLTIVPLKANDNKSKIKYVEIFSSNYKTEQGVSINSVFSDVNKVYTINKVASTLSSAILYIDELNATLSIDKSDLGLDSFSVSEVSLDQIPDSAKIKSFTIWFE